MIASMTGFGRGEAGDKQTRIQIEIRSVNHRFLDLKVRLPREISAFEAMVREKIGDELHRGSVDLTVSRYHLPTEEEVEVHLNLPLAKRYQEVLLKLSKTLNLHEAIDLETIARFHDVIHVPPMTLKVDREWNLVEHAIDQALLGLLKMREREGGRLGKDIYSILNKVEKLTNAIKKQSTKVVENYRSKLQQRIEKLGLETSIDPLRLAQEVVLYADRSDISEELARLESHIAQFKQTLKKGGIIGRRLDFLVQELHREVNTIGTKMVDMDIAILIDLKTAIEKIREQVKNIE